MASSVPPLPGIDTFVDALEQLVKLPPGKRGPSPLVLLSQLEEGREAEQIADGLCARFRVGGRARVPYAQVAGPPSGPRNERIGDVFQKLEQELERNRPGGFGRLRLPQFKLMCSIIETDLTERQSAVQARELRERCFAERRKDSNLLKVLETVSGGDQAPSGLPAFLWYWTRQPLFNVLPRWLYGRLQERRMTHKGSWYRQWAELPKGTGFFRDARRFAGTAPGTAPGPELPDALYERAEEEPETEGEQAERLELTAGLLLRALLADLERAFRRPRLSPWGRRRKSRFVIVLPQIGASPEWADRLVEQFPAAVEQTGSTGVVLVAAERSAGKRTESFAEAAITLRSWQGTTGPGGGRAVRVGVRPQPDDPGAARWLGRHPEIYPERDYSDVAPRVEAALAVVLALGLLGTGVSAALQATVDGPSDRCIGGAVAKAHGSASPRRPADPYQAYRQARELVRKNNAYVADKAAEKPREAVVRTVVYLGVPVQRDAGEEAVYSGAVPELRGIALAQKRLNEEAALDRKHRVFLRLRIEDAGRNFAKAPAFAEDLAEEIASGDADDVVGVVGLGQSRKSTMDARDTLGDEAELAMVGTVATAEAMQNHRWYRQVAPDNAREARIAADFARRGNIVQTAKGSKKCVPARRAVVIADPDDEYSANLSSRFREEFERGRSGGATHTLFYSPDGEPNRRADGGRGDGEWVASPSEMASEVCRRLREDRATVVYWAERANEFGAFLNEFDAESDCKGRVSVLGGNDLTNSVVEEERPSVDHPDARLYYAAHALPATHGRTSGAHVFRREHEAEFGMTDRWSNDGRTPLAWDAMWVLSDAVDTALRDSGKTGVQRSTVRSRIVAPSKVRGATGPLEFGSGAGVPRDKRLLILHDTPKGAEVALECGLRDDRERTRWGTDEEFDCPQDGGS